MKDVFLGAASRKLLKQGGYERNMEGTETKELSGWNYVKGLEEGTEGPG